MRAMKNYGRSQVFFCMLFITFFLSSTEVFAQQKNTKVEPNNRWSQPFIKVKKIHQISYGFVQINSGGILLEHWVTLM